MQAVGQRGERAEVLIVAIDRHGYSMLGAANVKSLRRLLSESATTRCPASSSPCRLLFARASTHRESLGSILLNGVTGDAGATNRGIAGGARRIANGYPAQSARHFASRATLKCAVLPGCSTFVDVRGSGPSLQAAASECEKILNDNPTDLCRPVACPRCGGKHVDVHGRPERRPRGDPRLPRVTREQRGAVQRSRC